MKTDNSKLSSECLEDAIYRHYPEDKDDYESAAEREAFANGWKERDKHYADLIQSHAELLAALKTIIFIVDMSERYEASKRIVEKANSIINSLK